MVVSGHSLGESHQKRSEPLGKNRGKGGRSYRASWGSICSKVTGCLAQIVPIVGYVPHKYINNDVDFMQGGRARVIELCLHY